MYNTKELTSLKLKELLDIGSQVEAAIREAKVRDAKQVRQEMADLAKRRGFRSLDEIFGRKLGHAGKGGGYKSVMAPKFANPHNPKETWTGHGRKPNWMVARLDKGATLDDFRV